jgi:PhnB protein
MKHMPPGYHSVTPYLKVRDAAAMFDFYKRAFNATELMRVPAPDGSRLMHCEVRIGDSQIMFADEDEATGMSPRSLGKSHASIMLYVEDADAVYKQAIAAGAKAVSPMDDKEYGRTGGVEDPSGYSWWITTHKG